ncbi:MAG: sugar phosphate isomerase/epimerase [Chloroflexi bacterium]|nr:sugar phosphate isomerase/epimerase [Chloroflexota bacterium]
MIPFRLGVITDEISADFEKALDVMLEYDVRQVEIRELWGKNVLRLNAEEMSRAREAVQRRGMEVCSIASPFYKCSLGIKEGGHADRMERKMHGASEAAIQEQAPVLERACELAHYFGARLVRVFAFWRDIPVTPEVHQAIKDAFTEPIEIARQQNLTLGLENEHACLIGTGVEAGPLLMEIGSPHLRSVWDPGNAFQLGERPFPDGYLAVRDVMTHMHVKDARTITREDGSIERPWTVIGDGEIDYPSQFKALIEDDYRGVVSLETHYRGPGGEAESGSRACLAALQRMLRDLS